MTKFIKYLAAAILLLFTQRTTFAQYLKTGSCINQDFDRQVDKYISYSAPVIDVKDAYLRKDKITFLDARENEEYKVSHIATARYIGYDDFNIKSMSDIDKNAEIVVYCSIGYRSEKIANKLIKAGYKNVKNLYGSIFEWANRGYELSDRNGKKTTNIHAYNKKWSKWVNNPTMTKTW